MAIKVKINNDDVQVRFDHMKSHEVPLVIKKLYPHENISFELEDNGSRCTIATIMLNDKPMISGVSFCSPVDNFCKSFGRKIALFRAIKASRENDFFKIDKDLSRLIWEEYFSCCK